MEANEKFLRALFSMETGREAEQLVPLGGMKYRITDEQGKEWIYKA